MLKLTNYNDVVNLAHVSLVYPPPHKFDPVLWISVKTKRLCTKVRLKTALDILTSPQSEPRCKRNVLTSRSWLCTVKHYPFLHQRSQPSSKLGLYVSTSSRKVCHLLYIPLGDRFTPAQISACSQEDNVWFIIYHIYTVCIRVCAFNSWCLGLYIFRCVWL